MGRRQVGNVMATGTSQAGPSKVKGPSSVRDKKQSATQNRNIFGDSPVQKLTAKKRPRKVQNKSEVEGEEGQEAGDPDSRLHNEEVEDEDVQRPKKRVHLASSPIPGSENEDEAQKPENKTRRIFKRPSDSTSDDSDSNPSSPPQTTAQSKGKGPAIRRHFTTPPHTQQRSPSQPRSRPGPNPQVQFAARQLKNIPPAQHQNQGAEQGSGSRHSREVKQGVESWWTHTGKVYGIAISPWIPESDLSRVLSHYQGQELPEDLPYEDLLEVLEWCSISHHERKNPRFLSNFLLGLRELRSEIVSTLSRVAMEVLGFNATPESQFRDQAFNKSEHPGFLNLLENNKFLGVGDDYLCSEPIKKALRVILCGPASINIPQNSARSRKNRFGITQVPAALLAFSATVIYFLLHGTGNFEPDPQGESEYQVFFNDRHTEIKALGSKTLKKLFETLDEEVFGINKKEATQEQKRQKEFSATQLQAIKAQAALEDAEEDNVGDGNDDNEQKDME